MTREARNHHYLPQCYLRGFTDSGGKKGKICVYDLRDKRVFATHPKNVASRRDFNRIDVDGHPSDALEQALATFESRAAGALKRVRQEHCLPDGEDFAVLMNLIGLMAVRNPHHRHAMDDFHADIARKTMRLVLATKDRWNGTVRRMKADGIEIDESISYEDLKQFYGEGQYDINTSRDWLISLELHGFEAVLPTLFDRKWALYIAETSTGSFISGDHPVTLMWTDPKLQQGPYPPGHGMSSTELVLPLFNKLALVGTFEGKKEGNRSRGDVAVISMACRFAGSNFWRFYRKSASQHIVFKRVIPHERLQKKKCKLVAELLRR